MRCAAMFCIGDDVLLVLSILSSFSIFSMIWVIISSVDELVLSVDKLTS